MGNKCMKPKTGDSNKADPKDYKKLVKFDEEETEFAGKASTFYSDMESVEGLLPYLKANPDLKFLIESFLECPSKCNSMKCGQCTNEHCNNIKLSQERCEDLKNLLVKQGCKNHIEIKAWGCSHSEIKKDMMKMSPWKEPPPPPNEPEPAVEPPTFVEPIIPEPIKVSFILSFLHLYSSLLSFSRVPVSQAPEEPPPARDDTELLKRLAELEAREKAIREKEEALEAEASQAKLKEAKLQQAKEALEETTKEAEAAKKRALENETRAAIAMAEAEKRIADAAEREALEREELEKAKAKFEEEMQAAHDSETQEMLEKQRQYEDSLRQLEKKKQEAELAAREAEKRKEAADAALVEANEKKAAYEAAAAKAEQKRLSDEKMVADIMLEIEETLKEEIEFVKNQATLTSQGEAVCAKVIPFLLRLPDMVIHIESHTNCFHGKCDGAKGCYLKELSQQRVDTVRSYFLKSGCRNEFLTKGWGCKHPQLRNIRLVRIFPEKSHKRTIVMPMAR
jgi:outer membrane protein OmpA-like peptidoglycan-associated protein